MVRLDLALAADVRFGAGRVDEVPGVLRGLGSRVLLVTGRSPERVRPVRQGLEEAGLACQTFQVSGEPTVDLLRGAVQAARGLEADAVLGVGGGSALDVAKAAALLAPSQADPMEHLEVVGAGRPVTRPGLPCVAVPTTAGTGSEVTRNAVLAAGGVKASLRSPLMLPTAAVVDPDLLRGLPGATIASSGMDALSQLIEPLLSRRANPFTDALARDGVVRSARSLRRAYADGMTDPGVREDLALASLFGGLCLANSGLGAVHGLAAAAGARLSAPHGAVCAAVLSAAMEVNLRALRRRSPGHPALDRMAEVAALLTGRAGAPAEAGLDWLDGLTTALQIPGLGHHGLEDAAVPELVAAAQRASSMKGNPVDLTDDEVAEIITRSR